jgi:AraC family transcriptional regulator, positive regulator of tynA and feaB
LTYIEAPVPTGPAPLLDLQSVDEAQRAALWLQGVRSFFPGLSVRDFHVNPPLGSMRGLPFGSGRLWTILSPPLLVSHDPAMGAAHSQIFSVMLQLAGSTVAVQCKRRCLLRPGEFCVIDSQRPFELEVTEASSRIMFMQMPRHAVLGRHPYLEHHTAETFDPTEAGATLLRNLLLNALEFASFLEKEQRATALAGIIQLLGVPKLVTRAGTDEMSWRVRTALAFIDSQLSDRGLTADRVSKIQGISRRRLDEIMTQSVGAPVTALIWIRRLTQAATELLDPKYASRTVSQIAFAAGFEDAAHFTRAFRRRYQCTPGEWRRRVTHSPEASPGAMTRPS